jgi:hypothetical protein
MPLPQVTPLPLTLLFWLAAALVIMSQIMILRSTVRAMRAAESERARRGIEWAYAIVPAIALVVILGLTWQATQQHVARLELEARSNQVGAP